MQALGSPQILEIVSVHIYIYIYIIISIKREPVKEIFEAASRKAIVIITAERPTLLNAVHILKQSW